MAWFPWVFDLECFSLVGKTFLVQDSRMAPVTRFTLEPSSVLLGIVPFLQASEAHPIILDIYKQFAICQEAWQGTGNIYLAAAL